MFRSIDLIAQSNPTDLKTAKNRHYEVCPAKLPLSAKEPHDSAALSAKYLTLCFSTHRFLAVGRGNEGRHSDVKSQRFHHPTTAHSPHRHQLRLDTPWVCSRPHNPQYTAADLSRCRLKH